MVGAPAAGAQAPASVAIGGQRFAVIYYDAAFPNCDGAFTLSDRPVADAHLVYGFSSAAPFSSEQPSFALVRIDEGQTTIELPRLSWPGMTNRDRAAATGLQNALLHHEIGHIMLALSSAQAINERRVPIDNTNYQQVFHSLDAELQRVQDDYDAQTEHGIHQSALGPPLGGPDTRLRCH